MAAVSSPCPRRLHAWASTPFGVFVGLGVAVALASALRFAFLTDESFWGDEGTSVAVARLGSTEIAHFTSAFDTHPPLYYTLLHYWLAVFGDSELAVRSLSAVLGVLAVPVAFALARQVSKSAACGLGAAFLVSASPIQVEYSQEARMYTLLALTAGASALCLARLWRSSDRASVALYVVTTAAMLYTHAYGLFVLFAEAVYVLVSWRLSGSDGRCRARRFGIGGAAALALFAPWAAVLLRQTIREVEGREGATLDWLGAPGSRDAWDTVVQWWGAPFSAMIGSAIALIAIALAAWAWFRERRSALRDPRGRERPILLLAVLTVVPLALPYVISRLTPVHIFLYRYTTASAFAFAVLIAVVVFRLHPALRLVTFALLFTTLLAGTGAYYARATKTDIRSAVSLIEPQARSGDLIVVEPSWQWPVVGYYLPPHSGGVESDLDRVTSHRLEAIKARGGHVWLLHTYELAGGATEAPLAARVSAVYGPPRVTHFHGIDALRFG